MSVAHAESCSPTDRNLGIDLLRIFSLVLVILYHYEVGHFMLNGLHGVVIFFMISGYCMNFSTTGRGGFEFLRARFWRLFPTLAICATITTLVEFFLPNVMPDRTQPLLSYPLNLFCLTHGMFACDAFGNLLLGYALPFPWIDGAYWSLLVEIRFYLLLWLLYYALKAKHPYILIATLGLLAPLNLATGYISKSQDFLIYLSFFSFGMALSACIRGIRMGYLGLILSFSAFTWSSLQASRAISMNLTPETYISFVFCFIIFTAAIVIFRRPSNRATSYLGLLTYPIYLLHTDIGYISTQLLERLVKRDLSILLSTLGIIALAAAVQFLIKRYSYDIRLWSEREISNWYTSRFRCKLHPTK